MSLPETGLETDDGDGRVIDDGVSREALEHGLLAFGAARFAEAFFAEGADLVGADDEGFGMTLGDGFRLRERQALGEGGRRLARQTRLIDIGARHLEGQPEPAE